MVLFNLLLLDVCDLVEYEPLLARLASFDPRRLSSTDRDLLRICALAVSLERPGWPLLPTVLTRDAPSRIMRDNEKLELEISNALTGLAFKHSRKQLLKGLWCDILLPDQLTIVAATIPSDYMRDGKRLLGTLQFKHRLFRKLGYQVLVVSSADWEALSETEREQHLKKLVNRKDAP